MAHKKLPIKKRKGFSLVEVLVTAAIFAFAMAGILQLFIKCAALDQSNQNKGIATTHAETVMEDITEYMRSHEPSSLQGYLEHWNWNTVAAVSTNLGCAAAVYPCVLNSETITTTYSDADPTNHPPVITVTVRWKDRTLANERSLILKTFTAKRG